MVANDITVDGKIKAVFLSVIGSAVYGLLKNLLMPDKPVDKTYTELTKTLLTHYTPRPIVIAERYRFYKRDQQESESVSDFIVMLKKLASTCEFGNFLNEALRDRLVCGLRSKTCKRRLLTESDLTFTKAIEIARSMELARKDCTDLQMGRVLLDRAEASVNKVIISKNKSSQKYYSKSHKDEIADPEMNPAGHCWYCGGKHNQTSSRFKDSECYKCSAVGHIASKCKTRFKKTHHVEESDERVSESESELNGIYPDTDKSQEINDTLIIEGCPLSMEIDTGESVSVVPESFYKQYLSHMQLNSTAKKLRSYSGDTLKVLGELDVHTTYKEQRARLHLVLIARNPPALLGRTWLRKLKLDWSAIFSIQDTTNSDLDKILEQHTQLFDGEPGCIEGYKAEMRLNDGAKPVIVKARPVPYAVKPMVDQELDRQVHAGILKTVPYSEWASPVVVVPKADRIVRLFGDYKVSLNPAL